MGAVLRDFPVECTLQCWTSDELVGCAAVTSGETQRPFIAGMVRRAMSRGPCGCCEGYVASSKQIKYIPRGSYGVPWEKQFYSLDVGNFAMFVLLEGHPTSQAVHKRGCQSLTYPW